MRRVASLSLLLLVLLASSVALATTVVRMELKALVAESDAIVVGTVSDVDAKVHEDGRVYTHVRVTVDEVLQGEETEEVTIVHIGGRTEKLATVVHGMPEFSTKERALLFLEKPEGVKHFVVTGLSQGKFTLTEAEDGTVTLRPAGGDMALVKPIKLPTGDVKLERAEPSDIARDARTLDEMRRRIAEYQRDADDSEVE
jgi:hypothetical protein